MAKKKDKKEEIAWLFIPAGIFIGLGLGFYTGNIPMWLFIGLGGGFLLTALARMNMEKK